MKTNWRVWFLLCNAIVALLAAGCATQQTKSFNKEFGESFPASPNYVVENLDDHHFKIRVYQGVPLEGPKRVIYMKQAAQVVADAEGKRRGWERWDLNYIHEGDQGWMHVLVAEVDRKK